MAEQQKVNTPLIVTIGLVSATIVLVIIIGLQAWFYEAYGEEVARKADRNANWQLADLRLEQREKISTYKLIDAKSGTVQIPIDRAIGIWLERKNGKSAGQTRP